jgi:hypothetical protein
MALLDHFGNRDYVQKGYKIILSFDKETEALIGGQLRVTICDSNGQDNLRKSIPLSDLPTVTAANKTYLQNVATAITDDLLTQTGKTLYIPPPPEEP